MFNSYQSSGRGNAPFARAAALFALAAQCIVLLFVIGLFALLAFIAAKFLDSLWMMVTHWDGLNRHDTLLTSLAVVMLALMGALVLFVARGIAVTLKAGQNSSPWMTLFLLILTVLGAAQLMQVFLDIGNYADSQIYIMIALELVLLVVCFGVAWIERRSHISWLALSNQARDS